MATLAYTPIDDIEKIQAELRAGFNSGKTKSIAYRKYQLLQLAYLVQDNSKRFEDALVQDLDRPAVESQFLEIGASSAEFMHAYKNVESWAKPEKPKRSFNFMFMSPTTYKEPKGVVLIITPFNYPLWLVMTPMAGAIAAGNAVVLKPSESCPTVASLLAELFPKYIDPSLVRVVNGAIPETTKLLELPWDHSGARVGKIVAAAAAKTLTPASLEVPSSAICLIQTFHLGKSPAFIDPTSDLRFIAKRLLWGKFANAGQTCVAPDYAIVAKADQDKFVDVLKDVYAEFYPETTTSPPGPANITKMVHQQAWKRVNGLLQATQGTIVCGGEVNEAKKYIAPTIVKDVKAGDPLLSEEIFGPVLPILAVDDLDAGIAYVNAHDHPLALYAFTQNEAFKKKVFSSTQSGSASANETIIQPGVTGLPFGGIGASGYGYHTGKYGFLMFTHLRSSIDNPSWVDMILGARYPPYTDKKLKAVSRLAPKLPARPTGPPTASAASNRATRKWFFLALAVAVVGVLTKMKNRLGLGV
ncbi:NAD-aldehyde dehydrogenase [Mycena pura]|uniref:Aldehyde dehydrogenase n=1 Tax=Mycena pura TaxID=153505 RepID=A0AAD6VM29_9AGAR|nr:NAD-aldehyde dehydrogenase [Mycena pura]